MCGGNLSKGVLPLPPSCLWLGPAWPGSGAMAARLDTPLLRLPGSRLIRVLEYWWMELGSSQQRQELHVHRQADLGGGDRSPVLLAQEGGGVAGVYESAEQGVDQGWVLGTRLLRPV